MSFEIEPKENHTCSLFSQILNEFSQVILCHGFALLFPVTLHPHVRHYSAQALARFFWTPRTRGFANVIRPTHDTSFTMRGATDLILQHHQMLRLPRKMTRIIYPRDIWNVIYNARSNRSHPPTSPNAAPATQNDSHHLSSWHMKRYLQCAEEQASPANLTKYCACHAKWLSWLIFVTYATSFTMRGATGISLQPDQILRLPRKIALQKQRKMRRKQLKRQFQRGDDSTMIRPWSEHDPTMIRPWTRHLAPARSPKLLFALRRRILYWKLQHFALRLSTQISPNTAPATKSDTPRSPNTAPATQHDSHDWCPSHMTRHLQCAEQQISSSNISKCCACHAKWLASSILVTYKTLFTMRGATSITLQPHQMLPLPRKMMRIIDCRRIWNVIYNARSNRHHPPTSPNTAPATQNCTPKSKKNLPKTVEASFPMRGRFEHDPSMIRTWSDHEIAKLNPSVRRAYFSPLGNAFCIENYNISRSGYLLKFHRILRLPRKVTLQDHQILRLPRNMTLMIDVRHTWHVIYNARSNRSHPPTSPNAAPATQNDSHHLSSWHMKRYLQCAEQQASPSNLTKCCRCHEKWRASLIVVAYETSFTMRGATSITLQPHQMLELWLYWPVTWLSCLSSYFTAVTWLSCYLAEQLLHCCYFTELLLYWAVSLLSCYFTELLLYWAVTWLSCYFTELLLDWAVTLLSCYFTELLLYWAVTLLSLLSCYFTELLLYWAVTLLSCYFTELLLDWAVTSLSCYLTVLLYWAVTLLSCYCIF